MAKLPHSFSVFSPRDFLWTAHARAKMRQYGFSEQRVKRVLHAPRRTEEGIAPKTVAMMQPSTVRRVNGIEKWSQEIWVMFQDMKGKRKIISAWRYPGMTKPGQALPAEIVREIRLNAIQAKTAQKRSEY